MTTDTDLISDVDPLLSDELLNLQHFIAVNAPHLIREDMVNRMPMELRPQAETTEIFINSLFESVVEELLTRWATQQPNENAIAFSVAEALSSSSVPSVQQADSMHAGAASSSQLIEPSVVNQAQDPFADTTFTEEDFDWLNGQDLTEWLEEGLVQFQWHNASAGFDYAHQR